MIGKRITIAVVFLMLISASSMNVLADQFGSVGIEVDVSYVDSQPAVWNTYVVWTRAVEMVEPIDGVIGREDPSWIMIHDITSEESWNITPTVDAGAVRSGTHYYHADTPNIYGDKVVYRDAYLTTWNSYVFGMYNISYNETWSPYVTPLGLSYCGNVAIYDDWIMRVHSSGGAGTGLLYNYKTNDAFYPNLYRDSLTHFSEYSIYNNYVGWSEYLDGYYSVFVFNLDNYKCIQINCTDKSSSEITQTRFCDIYYNKVLFKVLETDYSNWDMYVYDLDSVDWNSDIEYAKDVIGGINTPTQYFWNDLQGNVTNVSVGDNIDATLGKVWIDNVYYQVDQESGKIYKYYIPRNQTTAIIDIPYDVNFGDVQYDKVVWSDDRSGEYNIYRLTTTAESFGDIFVYALPVIFIGVVVVFFWKAFSEGLGGMI